MIRAIKMIFSGTLIGIAIGYLISLFFSVIYHANALFPSSPDFVRHFSSLTTATLAATGIWAAIGMAFGATSLIFLTSWSVTRQTVTHFLGTLFLFTPLAILAGWFPFDWQWLLIFLLMFCGIYCFIWWISMLMARMEVQQLNRLLATHEK